MQELLVFITAFCSGVGFSFFFCTAKEGKRNRFFAAENFRLRAKGILRTARESTSASNALLLHLHNGSQELKAGSTLYSSVVVEDPEDDRISAFKFWQDIKADPPYSEMIFRLARERFVFLKTDEMKPGKLKRLYALYGIRGSVVFHVYSGSTGGPYYASYPTREDPEALIGTPEFVILELNADALRSLCKEFDDKGLLH